MTTPTRRLIPRSLLSLSAAAPLLTLGLLGCSTTASFVRSDTTTLGRVVVYRNGVAYFERSARVPDDTLRLTVPADKVDDFLKSLTVIDTATGKAAPIAYPTSVPGTGLGTTEMTIQLLGRKPHDVKLSYVTESPSWKPSYRIVLGKAGHVNLQGWAIVDNTSGEDWKQVTLGVGSSSALSFRFDLRSVHSVARETLHSNDLFAQAPPLGGASYGQQGPAAARVLGEIPDDAEPAEVARTDTAAAAPSRRVAPAIARLAAAVQSSKRGVVIEGFADEKDKDKPTASLDRANRVRDELVQRGVDPKQIIVVGGGHGAGRSGGVRILEAPGPSPSGSEVPPGADAPVAAAAEASSEPIGASHFESTIPMNVPRATSAMVSILDAPTDGEVVYVYDPESPRGSREFPFKAVRIKNPTDSVLESGPVTVFGDDRFVGEGLSEPVPARSVAFIPFALDRQIVVEDTEADHDEIARIIKVQRGVFSSEMRHIRRHTFKLHSRMSERATVYVRHTVPAGYELTKGPKDPARIGNARLFRVEVEPNSATEVVVEETTPVYRTTDVRSAEGLEMVRAYLSSAAEGSLKKEVEALLAVQREIGNTEQRILTTREQMEEYRARMDELHGQIVTLRLVRAGGPMMRSLEKKLVAVSDRLSESTLRVANLQEQLMIARIHFEDGVADLSLDKAPSEGEKKTASS
jgi:hypothetical protein